MDSLKSILVHLDSSERSAQRLRLAIELGARHDASVSALYAVTPAFIQFPLAFSVGAEGAPWMAEFEGQRLARARATFEAAAARAGGRLAWQELRGEPAFGAARPALYADLLVLGQRPPQSEESTDVPRDFVESVLIASGKPGLVIPYIDVAGQPGREVLVAWNESRESARAVAGALPLLRRAERVHVVSFADAKSTAAAGAPGIEAYLRQHGVGTIQRHHAPGSDEVGESLLSLAADLGADLLVMGCYGHSRARELVLGGASRTVLQGMTLPVLMSA